MLLEYTQHPIYEQSGSLNAASVGKHMIYRAI